MLDYTALKHMAYEQRLIAIGEDLRRMEPPEVRALFEFLDWCARRPGFGRPGEFWRCLMQPRRPQTPGLPQTRDGQVPQ